jgi:hypothetical protein
MTQRISTVICAGSAALLLLVLPGATANAQTQMQNLRSLALLQRRLQLGFGSEYDHV